MTMIRNWVAALGLVVLTGVAQALPTYVCVGICTGIVITDPNVPIPPQGQLVNILNVLVDGTLYDVAFVDSSFNDIYGTGAPALAFTSQAGAERAAQALSNVLVDVGTGGPTAVQAFDSDPNLTRGCSFFQACLVMTPFEVPFFLNGAVFRQVGFVNDNPFLGSEPGDSFVGLVNGLLEGTSDDFALNPASTFAVWRVAGADGPNDPLNRFFTAPTYGAASPNGVPEPGPLLLIAVGLVGLLASRRRA